MLSLAGASTLKLRSNFMLSRAFALRCRAVISAVANPVAERQPDSHSFAIIIAAALALALLDVALLSQAS
jgi:hypothetical protein